MSVKTRKSRPVRRRIKSAAAGLPAAPSLLGRPAVNLDTPELQRFIAGKTILVTGAGGSIGSEICRQALRFCPQKLVLLDRAEPALFEIDRELRERWVGAQILPVIADITDSARIDAVLAADRPQVIFHAAAHKHVPMMEANPGEAVKNNVFGTQRLAIAAAAHGVETFVLISTDKAVNPTSVMGASKRVAEMVVQAMNSCQLPVAGCQARPKRSLAAGTSPQATRYMAVRFGNVLGSSGSVVPIFRNQIARGGPVTVTHPDMRRFFMTIPEASQLVMQAAAIGSGGEVMVLDMGEQVRILDLAHQMIREAGKQPGRDIQIQFSGIRPGEKLYEELAGETDHTLPTSHDRIRVWELPRVEPRQLEATLGDLSEVVNGPPSQVIASLMRAVREFQPEHAPALRLAEAA